MNYLSNITINTRNLHNLNSTDTLKQKHFLEDRIQEFLEVAANNALATPLQQKSLNELADRFSYYVYYNNSFLALRAMQQYNAQYPLKKDLILVTGNEKIMVNRTLFKLCSPKFAALIASRVRATDVINLDHISLKDLHTICEYIHTSRLPNVTASNLGDILNIAAVANELDMPMLVEACDTALSAFLKGIVSSILDKLSKLNGCQRKLGKLIYGAQIAKILLPFLLSFKKIKSFIIKREIELPLSTTQLLSTIGLPLPKLQSVIIGLYSDPNFLKSIKHFIPALPNLDNIKITEGNSRLTPLLPLLNNQSASDLALKGQLQTMSKDNPTLGTLEEEQKTFPELALELRSNHQLQTECKKDSQSFFKFFIFLAANSANADYAKLIRPAFNALVDAYANGKLNVKDAEWLIKIGKGFLQIRDDASEDALRLVIPSDLNRSHLSINHYVYLCFQLKCSLFKEFAKPLKNELPPLKNELSLGSETSMTYEELSWVTKIVTSENENWLFLENQDPHRIINVSQYFLIEDFLPKYENFLINKLNTKNAAEMLTIAKEYTFKKLHLACTERLVEEITSLSQSRTSSSSGITFSGRDHDKLTMKASGRNAILDPVRQNLLSGLASEIGKIEIKGGNRLSTVEKIQRIFKAFDENVGSKLYAARCFIENAMRPLRNRIIALGLAYTTYNAAVTPISHASYTHWALTIGCVGGCLVGIALIGAKGIIVIEEIASKEMRYYSNLDYTSPSRLLDRTEVISSDGPLLSLDQNKLDMFTKENPVSLLDIYNPFITLKKYPELLSKKGWAFLKQLKRLKVLKTEEISSKGQLLSVDMSKCVKLTRENLLSLIATHPHIRTLKISASNRLTREDWGLLKQLRSLEVLKIDVVNHDISELRFLNLTELSESSISFQKTSICLSLKTINRKTDLTFFNNIPNDIDIHLRIQDAQSDFEHITISELFKPRFKKLEEIVKRCPHITSFDNDGYSLRNTPYIETQRIGDVSSDDLQALGRHCKNLRTFKFELPYWHNMSDLSQGLRSMVENCRNLTSFKLGSIREESETVISVFEAIATHSHNIQKTSLDWPYTVDNKERLQNIINQSLCALAMSKSLNAVVIAPSSRLSEYRRNHRKINVSQGVTALLERKPNSVENIVLGRDASVSVDLYKLLRNKSMGRCNQDPEMQEFLQYRKLFTSFDSTHFYIPEIDTSARELYDIDLSHAYFILNELIHNSDGLIKLIANAQVEDLPIEFITSPENLEKLRATLGMAERDHFELDTISFQSIARLLLSTSSLLKPSKNLWKEDPPKNLSELYSWWDFQIQSYPRSFQSLNDKILDFLDHYLHMSKMSHLKRKDLEEYFKLNKAAIKQWFLDKKAPLEGLAWGVYSENAHQNDIRSLHGLWENPAGGLLPNPEGHRINLLSNLLAPLETIYHNLLDDIATKKHLFPEERTLLFLTAILGTLHQAAISWAALIDPRVEKNNKVAPVLPISRAITTTTESNSTSMTKSAGRLNDDSNLNFDLDEKSDF